MKAGSFYRTHKTRAIKQSLICIFTIDALSNARYEIAEKNIAESNKEITRAVTLLKSDEQFLKR